MTHREEAIFLPSNVYKEWPDVIRPPVSSMWSKELKRIWPRLLLIGLLPDMNGKGGDRTALTASAIWATEDTEEGKKARKLPSILDRSASRWQIKSAPWTPPSRPDRMTFTAIKRTLDEKNIPSDSFSYSLMTYFIEFVESGQYFLPRRRLLPSWCRSRRYV